MSDKIKKYRIRRPKKLLEPLILEVPPPTLIHDVNDRALFNRSFERSGVDILYSCNYFNFEVEVWRKCDVGRYMHTGGNKRFFACRNHALEDAFNIRTRKRILDIESQIQHFKRLVNNDQ